MENEQNLITGNIKLNNENIVFTCEDFKFTFVRSDNQAGRNSLIVKPDEDGYIWGKTYAGKPIAIFIKNEFEIIHTKVINTWNYVIANHLPYEVLKDIDAIGLAGATENNIGRQDDAYRKDNAANHPENKENNYCGYPHFLFRGIHFKKGPINSVFPCNAITEDFEIEDELSNTKNSSRFLVYRTKEQGRKIIVPENDENISWYFGTTINKWNSIDDGIQLRNTDSYLTIEFENPHSMKALYDYYGYVTAVMSFLTFRRNISFEALQLLTSHPRGGLIPFADCYVKIEGKVSKRSMMNSLTIYRLSDEVFRNIVYSEMDSTNKKTICLPLSIIAKSDNDVGYVTTDRIRDICSSLESEIDYAGIKMSLDDELRYVIGIIRSVLKGHRKGKFGKKQLPPNTYQNMYSSIGHWGDTAADRAIKAWYENKEECECALSWWRCSIKDVDIADLIKTRNNITHRGFREFSERDANTAIAMIVLVYVLALKRVGLDKMAIEDLMNRRFMG